MAGYRYAKHYVKLRDKLTERAVDIALEIADEIALIAPKGPTGRLRESFSVTRDANGDALVVTSAPYWRYVEFGTKEHGDAQHPIRTAVEYVRAKHGI